MTVFDRFLLALAAPVAIVLALPAAAQSAPEIAGPWHGSITTPQGSITLVWHVARGGDGALGA